MSHGGRLKPRLFTPAAEALRAGAAARRIGYVASGSGSNVSGGNIVAQGNFAGWSGGSYHSP